MVFSRKPRHPHLTRSGSGLKNEIYALRQDVADALEVLRGPFASRPAPSSSNLGTHYVADDYPWEAIVREFGGQPRWMPVSYGSLAINGWEGAALAAPLPAFNFRFGVRTAPGAFTVASVAGQACDATAFTNDGSASGFMFFGGWAVVDIVSVPVQSGTVVQTDTDGSMIALAGGEALGVVYGYGSPGSAVNVWLFS